MDLQQFLLIAATVVLAAACRTFSNRYVRKLGWFAMLAATYMVGYFLTQRPWVGLLGVALWFLLPWLDIVAHVRHLRFTLKNEIKGRFPPSQELFPELSAITREIEDHGFERVEDAGWEWTDTEHFLRLFYQNEKKVQAAIGMASHEVFSFSYVSLTSRTRSGETCTTTNYPFPANFKLAPNQRIQRVLEANSMADLIQAHESYLKNLGYSSEDLLSLDTANLPDVIAQDMETQMTHNLRAGVIEPVGEGFFRYSWRGCFFLWLEIVKDLVKI